MLHIGSGEWLILVASLTVRRMTCGFANRAANAMPVHLSGPMAISNDRDSHVLGMRTCDKFCSDEIVRIANLRLFYLTVPRAEWQGSFVGTANFLSCPW